MSPSARQRVWGWYFFDWASQPYATLLLTFVFAPYVNTLVGDGVRAQSLWGFTTGAAALVIAVSAPILGAMADQGTRRLPWIWAFSLLYVMGAATLWGAAPGTPHLYWFLAAFAVGLVAMEFATIFTNAMLPDLAPREELGAISGTGYAFGYVGGFVALVIMLLFFMAGDNGLTMLQIPPVFGLDPDLHEGTRAVGPFTALWFAVFMVPFFLWVRERPNAQAKPLRRAAADALPQLIRTLRDLPRTPSLFSFLGASMLYRDALAGMYAFGAIYAAGVLEWRTEQLGIFGIIAIIAAAVFSWIGGRADNRYGPKPVILASLLVLTAIAIGTVFINRSSVLGLPVDADSQIPDVIFFVFGAGIGAAGGTLQAASRTMMCRQAGDVSMTQAFGLYALAGKATAFLAPTSIAIVTSLTGNQALGISPLIVLFLLGLFLLRWVKHDGDRAA